MTRRVILSIIILSWNTLQLTRNCLRSIFDNVKDINLEVIVVDNGSHDGSADMIEQEFPQVKLIESKVNLGFEKGNNTGYQESRGKYVLFLNSDTIIPSPPRCHSEHFTSFSASSVKNLINTEEQPTSMKSFVESAPRNRRAQDDKIKYDGKSVFKKMVEAIQADDKIGALSPCLIYPDGCCQIEFYRKFPNILQLFLLDFPPINRIVLRIPFLLKLASISVDFNKSGEVKDGNLPGAAVLVSREALEKVGGWDDKTFWIWLGDADLCYQILKAGYKLYYLADVEIVHFGGQSTALWGRFDRIYNFREGYLKYFRKNKGKFQAFLVKWIFIFNALILVPPLFLAGIFDKKYWQAGIAFWQFAIKFIRA